jgi:hypothetical protein
VGPRDHFGGPGADVSRPPDFRGQDLLEFLVLARGVDRLAVLEESR